MYVNLACGSFLTYTQINCLSRKVTTREYIGRNTIVTSFFDFPDISDQFSENLF